MVSKSDICSVFESEIGASVHHIELLETGIEESAIVETKHGEKYVVKIHENDVYESPRGFLAGVFLLEQVARATEIPVPEVFVIGDDSENLFGTPFYIMEYIDGFHFDIESYECGG